MRQQIKRYASFCSKKRVLLLAGVCSISCFLRAQDGGETMSFTVSMPHPETQTFHVAFHCSNPTAAITEYKMPSWTPGYYQIMDYAKNVSNFRATDLSGNTVQWENTALNTWKVINNHQPVVIHYDVKATRPFVATSFLDTTHGYIVPASLFLYVNGKINHPVTVTVKPYEKWTAVATGLDSVNGQRFVYTAPDFDILYDCPILIGNLESLPVFYVRGIPHRFIGYQLGNFDRAAFVDDLKKIVTASAAIIGDIPYKQYTFIAIGPGMGGIEHLNSTTISFNGSGLQSREGRIRLLHFIAHEYFHHYNVKRIRPIELGPFDYDKGSPTKLLWVSEGLTVYYEYLVLRQAGISTDEELLRAFRATIASFENKPGHLFQTLEQASYETWSDGPFGRTGDDINKTISYYEKGPAVGLLLDFAIRHETGNKRSLDDVMRTLYQSYYQQKKRGFTAQEFRQACEQVAGTDLSELFEYVTTVKNLDYPKYLSYAGLQIDTSLKELPGPYLGLSANIKNDSLVVVAVDWQSAAWNIGIRPRDIIEDVNDSPVNGQPLETMLKSLQPGNTAQLVFIHKGERKTINLTVTQKKKRSFNISPIAAPTREQAELLNSWLGNRR